MIAVRKGWWLRTEADAMLPDLVALRRRLHRHPEIGLQLPSTQAEIVRALDGLGIELRTGRELSSVVGVLRGSGTGPTVLLRADMDALPIREQTGLDYKSDNGAMHACGHDLHVAGLVGAARLLASHRELIAGSVVLMFQPGEESGGGAQAMLAEGLLDAAGTPPVAAYGIHVIPGTRGLFGTRPGPIMAGASVLEVTITGRGGHGSTPHEATDPVPALAEVVTALQTFATRRFAASEPVVISVTVLAAGEASNIISDRATLRATVRTLGKESVAFLRRELPVLIQGIATAHRCAADVELRIGYPVTVNDRELAERAVPLIGALLGPEWVHARDHPLMASEDFAYILDSIPGVFLLLGATPPELDPAAAEFNHSPRALFDDAVLGDQAAVLAALALSHVGSADDPEQRKAEAERSCAVSS